MVQVVEQDNYGSKLGQTLGKSTSGALELLIQSKLKGMQDRNKLSHLQSILSGQGSPQSSILEEGIEAERSPGGGAITDEQILAVNSVDPNMAKLLQTQKGARSSEAASKFKETKETRKDLLSKGKAAVENNMRLGRMEELNNSGKLVTGLYNDMLKRFGIDYAALKNPDSQEFEKLSTDMLRNAKEIFGSRVTNLEVQTFLKTIPTLSQTQEGRTRVIRNLRLLNEGELLRSKAMKDILKENQGVPPYDIGEQVEEKVGPQLEQISEKFVSVGRPDEGTQSEAESFPSLPSAAEYKGKIIRDTDTGKRLKSDGVKWKVIK
jgi:hypothetical protein